MHEILTSLNTFVDSLGKIDPAWYVVVVGPLAAFAQHFLKKERDFSKHQNVLVSLGLAFVTGGFYAVMRASSLQQAVTTFAHTFPALWTAGQAVFYTTLDKVEAYNQLTATAPAAPVAPEAPAPVQAAAPVDAGASVNL